MDLYDFLQYASQESNREFMNLIMDYKHMMATAEQIRTQFSIVSEQRQAVVDGMVYLHL